MSQPSLLSFSSTAGACLGQTRRPVRLSLLMTLLMLLGLCGGLTQTPEAPLERPAETTTNAAVDTTNAAAKSSNLPAKPRLKSTRIRYQQSSSADHVVVGDDLVLKEDETARDVVVVGGSALIEGKITGDLVVILGGAKLGPKAEVRKELIVLGGGLEADPGAKLGPGRVVFGAPTPHLGKATWLHWPAQWFQAGLMRGRLLPHQYGWSWAAAGVALLCYLTLAVLFPRQVQAVVSTLDQRPGNAWLTGVLAAMLLAPFLLFLTVTVIGVALIPVALAAFGLAFVFGKVAVCRYAGQQLGGQLGSGFFQQPLWALLAGAILLSLLYTVPVLGVLAWMAAAPLGLGAVLLTVFKAKPRPAGMAQTAVAVPAGQAQLSPAAEAVQLLPRAGFWIRFLASLLDLLLVGAVVSVVFHQPRWFLLLWAAYHLAFWSWRGVTVGGMILGLRIVRLDGKPMNFAVALVRLFASLFSLAAAALGFFWAGWTQEKQSWHDKIAGTVIVSGSRTGPGP